MNDERQLIYNKSYQTKTWENVKDPIIVQESSGDIHIKRAEGDVLIVADSSGRIIIDHVIGNVNIIRTGVGQITLRGGEIFELEINNQGPGDIFIKTTVETGKVINHGVGKVFVKQVESIREFNFGAGSINIGLK